MKKSRSFLFVVSLPLAASVALVACGDDDDDGENNAVNAAPEMTSNTIVDIAAGTPGFSTLVAAVQQADLVETLSGPGPFTVFAPTDDAFARLPAGIVGGLDKATLTQILTYHVLPAKVGAEDAMKARSAKTVNGEEVGLQVADSKLFLDGLVQVVQKDIEASNGVIHVIDSVLLPESIGFPGNIVEAVMAYPRFSNLVSAVVAADLAGALKEPNGDSGFTLFAPTNSAFAKLGVDADQLPKTQLSNILLYHVVGASVEASQVVSLKSAMTLADNNISIAVRDGVVRLNENSIVTRTDIRASNGVIHVIDTVLQPPMP